MRILGVASILVGLASLAHADTIKTGGNVINETWTPGGSPYIVQGDLNIPLGSVLTIQAGTTIQIASGDLQATGVDSARVELLVRGSLVVEGTAAQPVQITAQSATPGAWYGVVVDGTATGTAITATHLTMANPVVGIYHRSANATAATSDVSMTGVATAGVRVEAGSPTYNGIATTGGSYGFEVQGSGSATFTNCLARNTTSMGARFVSSSSSKSMTLIRCTLNENGSVGVYSSAGSSGAVTVQSSIVTGSNTGCFRADFATWSVTYSNVWNNTNNYSGGSSAGTGTLSSNPLYVSATNLRLTSNSPSRFGAMDGTDMGARPYTNDPTPGLYGVLWTNTTLTAAGSPHAVGGDLSVGPSSTLTLQPGATLRFAANDIMESGVDTARGELVVRGPLVAAASSTTPVVLEGTSTSPGSWYGIVIDATATGTALMLAGVQVSAPVVGIYHRSATASVETTNVAMSNVATAGVRVEAGNPTYDGIATSSGSYGFEVQGSASATFTNCVARNTTSMGARFVSSSSSKSMTLVNCTLNENGSVGVYSSAGSSGAVTVRNSIVTSSNTGCFRADFATWSVTYSDVWDNTNNYSGGSSAGTGTISANPQYVSSTNLMLQSTSVAIDSATASGAPPKDQRGAARPVNGDGINGAEFDMGAYEFAATAVCGNGATEGSEVCDSGPMNGMYGYCNAGCTALGPRCGDTMTNGPETCDDGNATDTDACRNNCVAAACGDGVIYTGVETCDDGNTVPTDACTASCQSATCGDNVVQAGVEACDDGNAVDTDACHGCIVATCGDGIVRAGVEGCDDGNTIETDACNNACVSTTCGDGIVQAPNEQCDDGNDVDTDDCRNACIDPICGDSITNGEDECDDGNTENGDGCSASCTYENTGPGPDAGEPGMDSDGGCCDAGRGHATSALGMLALAFVLRRRKRRA